MFKNIRVLTVTFSIALSIIVILLSFILKNHFLVGHVSKAFEEPLESLMKNYNTSVWDRYYNVLDYLRTIDQDEWQSYPQYLGFAESTRKFFNIDKVIKSTITIDNRTIVFDSKPNLHLEIHSELFHELTSYIKTESIAFTSKIVNASFEENSVIIHKKALQISLPIKVSKSASSPVNAAQIHGRVDIFVDLSYFQTRLNYIQSSVLSLFALIILCFNIIILIFSKKVEELIAHQQEASSELTKAKSMAESESKAKSQFLANVSHELRTPLNAIIGFSEIIRSESMGPIKNEQYKEFVSDIHSSGVHLLSLINDILDYSKAEENKMSIMLEPTDLTKVIKLCLRMVKPKADIAEVNLIDHVPAEHIVIPADQKRIKQVLLNLLSNAVKFTKSGGSVEIYSSKDLNRNLVSIEIKDSGIGMAA
ncbi:MAG: ATP-binding protein, partial [Candidatus Jidaibacter sp.]|nr:ATP-binding protein [Candidatus Jidaibacter sp.]